MNWLLQFQPKVLLFFILIRPLQVGSGFQHKRNVRADSVLQLILQYQYNGISEKYREVIRAGQVTRLLFSLLSITQFVLSHVGFKLTPLALYKSVREDHQELGTPVYAIHYILRHRHSNLINTEYPRWQLPFPNIPWNLFHECRLSVLGFSVPVLG